MAMYKNIHLKKLSADEIASLDLAQTLERIDQIINEEASTLAMFAEALSQENFPSQPKKKLLKVSHKPKRFLGNQA